MFNLALFQLERLHAIGADELLEQMAGNRRRLARTSALALSLVLLGAGLLVARIFYLLTALHGVHILGGLIAFAAALAGRANWDLCAGFWHL